MASLVSYFLIENKITPVLHKDFQKVENTSQLILWG